MTRRFMSGCVGDVKSGSRQLLMTTDQDEWLRVSQFAITCLCGDNVEVGVLAQWQYDDAGVPHLILRGEEENLWAHQWMHEQGTRG